jgi:ABC-type polysaccharide/polyol phosphate export permease
VSVKDWWNSLKTELQEVWRYRELLGELVQRELDVRYKNSMLGVLWSLANPIVRALILWAVFEFILNLGVRNYSAYLLAAFFPWTFFLTGILDACDSVSKQMPLIRKVYFPRELLPLATTIANLRHYLLSLCVLGVYLVFLYGRDSINQGTLSLPPWQIVLIPLLIIMQTLLIGGIALFLSALNVFYEDVKFLVAVIMDLMFYAVPIVYFLEMIPIMPKFSIDTASLIYALFLMNPFTVILVSYRSFLLHPAEMPLPEPIVEKMRQGQILPAESLVLTINKGVPWDTFWLSFLLTVLVFIGGYTFFNRMKWRFVEQ